MGKYGGLVIALLLFSSEIKTSPPKLDIQDLEFMEYLVQVYFCTGDPNWWKLVGKRPEFKKHFSGLRFIMHAAVAIWCPSYHLTEENKAHLIDDAEKTMAYDTTGFGEETLEEIGECLLKAIYNRILTPYFCPNTDEDRDGVSAMIEHAHKHICSNLDNTASKLNHFACSFLVIVPIIREPTGRILEKFGFCPKKVQKRQYDLVTILTAFDAGCSGFVSTSDLKIKYGGKHSKLYFVEFYCCLNLEYL